MDFYCFPMVLRNRQSAYPLLWGAARGRPDLWGWRYFYGLTDPAGAQN